MIRPEILQLKKSLDFYLNIKQHTYPEIEFNTSEKYSEIRILCTFIRLNYMIELLTIKYEHKKFVFSSKYFSFDRIPQYYSPNASINFVSKIFLSYFGDINYNITQYALLSPNNTLYVVGNSLDIYLADTKRLERTVKSILRKLSIAIFNTFPDKIVDRLKYKMLLFEIIIENSKLITEHNVIAA